jgi:excisionase family DNA binding protein
MSTSGERPVSGAPASKEVRPQAVAGRRLYTTAEAADILGVSYDWLKKQLTARRFTHVRFGRSVRLTEEHLDRIIAACELERIVVSPKPRRRRSRL